MSFESWKKEFYGDMGEACNSGDRRKIVEHSLRKWRGLSLENLAKHGVRYDGYYVGVNPGGMHEEDHLPINSESCSLCDAFWESESRTGPGVSGCRRCPIVLATGGTCHAAFGEATAPDDDYEAEISITPMIQLLEETLQYVIDNPEEEPS